MAVFIFHSLKPEQKTEVLRLIAACNQYDGLVRCIPLEEDDNYDRELRSYFLYYREEELVSVLLLYQPYPEEAEVSAYTLPSHRRQGYFKALYREALKELKKFHIRCAVFVTEKQSESGKACALAMKGIYTRSDYLMAYSLDRQEDILETPEKEGFLVKILTKNNLEDGIGTFRKVFGWEREQIQELLEESLHSPDYRTFLAYLQGKAIGTISLHFGKNEVSIYGFGILESFRGKGYGKYFLSWVLDALRKEGKSRAVLQVESESREACRLYQEKGFEITEQFDYYFKSI